MVETDTPIPSFGKPPVIEVVWSLQFSELSWLRAPDTGAFWSRICAEYPKCEEKPPIGRAIEAEEVLAPQQNAPEILAIAPLNRQWFISETGTELVQLQRDRFCYNWRKTRPGDVYPRHDHMKERFHENWESFCDFVEGTEHGLPQVDQCELTYINHLPQDEGWSQVGDIHKLFPSFAWVNGKKFLPSPCTLGCQLLFDLRGTGGRLHVSLRHGKKQDEPQSQVFVLELTARGKPQKTTIDGLLDWFSLAREWIVRGFADLTNPTMHQFWERER